MKRATNHGAMRGVLALVAAGAVTIFSTTLSAVAGPASTPSCSAATVTLQPPNAPGPWLDIRAAGLGASRWYSVFAATPTGWTEGVAVLADATGSFETTSLPATSAGMYAITVNRFHTKAMIASCGISVG